MSVEIHLSGEAAAQAQHLVADLAKQGVIVEPVNARDSHRDMAQSLTDLVVALAASASYELVRTIVIAWIRKFNLREEQVEIIAPLPEDSPK